MILERFLGVFVCKKEKKNVGTKCNSPLSQIFNHIVLLLVKIMNNTCVGVKLTHNSISEMNLSLSNE
ncbi:CLUMA_CG003594, isoform A [Clunio marinus]|uniref:CLUMA_CG003594, isoform A n=1 Tax=Clunio marinus TaxID=568069 RepID=A0A1J1HNM5_9DIPT|nr:CLUMA_CG003594, isoform A [Clunio marinus]